MKLTRLISSGAVSTIIKAIMGVAAVLIVATIGVMHLTTTTETAIITHPVAEFTFDYNESDKILTITHGGGDTIRGTNVYVRGNGFVPKSNANMSQGSIDYYAGRQNISWKNAGASMSGTMENVSAVTAGDTASVAVHSAYDIHVVLVWVDNGEQKSITAARDHGPDANLTRSS